MLQRLLLLFSAMISHLPSPVIYTSQKTSEIYTITQKSHNEKIAKTYRSLRKKAVFKENRETIRYALEHFQKVPGFSYTLSQLNKRKNSCIGGHLFEIEAAVALHKENYEITGLNQLKYSGDTCCEIDIEAIKNDAYFWIECKDSCWHNTSHVKNQLLRQRTILDAHSTLETTGIKHMLCSKKQMPDSLKKWLGKHEVVCRDQEFDEKC